MENLEDFMRRKFNSAPESSGDRFEFREEYWEQAQVLLEAEEAKRRKRRRWLLWWWFFGALAVGGGLWAVGTWQGGSGSGSSGSGSKSEMPYGGATSGISGDSAVVSAHGPAQNFSSKTPGTDAENQIQNIENQNIGSENSGDQPGTATLQAFSPKGNTASQGKAPSGNAVSGTSQAKNKAGDPANSIQPTVLVPTDQRAGQTTQNSQAGRTGPVAINAANALDSVGVAPVPDKAQKTPGAAGDFPNFDALPTLMQLLDLPVRPIRPPHAQAAAPEIKPVRKQKFSYGLAATGLLGMASPDGKRLGASGGVFAHYNLAHPWSLTAGLNWRYITGAWASDTAPNVSDQLRYSFGYQQDVWRLETQGLHFVEVPVGVRWSHGPFAASGGVAPGFLIGVQGRQVKEHSESLVEGTVTEKSSVWLDKTPYNAFAPAVFLGGEWMASQHVGLTLRGTFRPGSIGKKLIPDAAPPANLFWLDAGLRWYF